MVKRSESSLSVLGAIQVLLSGMVGFGYDQILAAKIITVDGTIIRTSAEAEPELLWVIIGPGQLFGVVLRLTIKIYP